jgi:hypothetical protein
MGTGSLCWGVKLPGRGANYLPSSSDEVKERVQLYLYSPSGLHGLSYGELYIFLPYIQGVLTEVLRHINLR